MYLGYNDFSPHNLFRFHIIHYVAWAMPLIFSGSIVVLIHLLKNKRILILIGSILLSFILLSYRETCGSVPSNTNFYFKDKDSVVNYEVIFSENRRVEAIDLFDVSMDDWTKLVTKNLNVKVDNHKLDIYRGYKTTPINGGIRIIFNKRINATKIYFTLDNEFKNRPLVTQKVSPIEFKSLLGWFRILYPVAKVCN